MPVEFVGPSGNYVHAANITVYIQRQIGSSKLYTFTYTLKHVPQRSYSSVPDTCVFVCQVCYAVAIKTKS